MFGESLNISNNSIDSSYVENIHEVTPTSATILLTNLSSTSNYNLPNAEPCAEKVTHEMPSLDITPMTSPYNNFSENDYVTSSTPLLRNLSTCDVDNCSSSSISRSNTTQLSNASSQNSPICSFNKSTPSVRIGRKRQRQHDEWKYVKRKCLKKFGKAYLRRNGVRRDAKILKQSCHITYRLKCFQKFNIQERERIFSSFWQIGDQCRQWDHIVNYIEVGDTKYLSTSNALYLDERNRLTTY